MRWYPRLATRLLSIGLMATLASPAWPAPTPKPTPTPAPAPTRPLAATGAPGYTAESFGDLRWRLVGPFRGGWSEMVEGVPNRPDTFYFGAAGGGVWRTDNAGQSWRSLFDQGPAPVGAIAVAPSDAETIYIGTGQPEPRYDLAAGAGVFGSHDGGKTWTALGLADTRYIGRIWIDPSNARTLLVAAVGHFFGPNPQRGVFRSMDGGQSWTQTLKIDDETGAVDLAADPKDPQTLIAASWQARQYPWQSYFQPVAGTGSALYLSHDGGVHWTRLAGQGWPAGALGRISVATARTAQGLRIYAVISAESASGLYRSDDSGATWQRVNDEQAFTSYYASRITVAPNDPDVVYTVGQSIRRCLEGGRRCEIIKGAPGGDDYHFVWINPEHPDHMATASDQGTAISVDGGTTWSSWYNQPTGQFYHLATDHRFPYWIYSGQQDSGTVAIASRSDYGSIGFRDWHPIGADERDFDIPDPSHANIVYGTGLGGRLSRYDSATGEVANITPFPVANYGKRQTTTEHHFVWVTPMAISQVGPTTLYVGGEVVFASTDQGRHWSVISPNLTGKAPGKGPDAKHCDGEIAIADAKTCGYGTIWNLTTSARRAGEIWVGTDDGLVQETHDGGKHWRDVSPKGVPAWAKIANVDLAATEEGVAYVAVDNQRQDDFQPHIFKTHDSGVHWQDATGDLPKDHFVSVVRADPVRSGLLYAGTDVGVYVSLDDGAHWQTLQHNLPTAWVRDLLVHGDDLIAATQGRALWVLDNVSPLRQVGATHANEPHANEPHANAAERSPHLFAPSPAYRVRANNNRDTPLPPSEPVAKNPPIGAIIDYWLPGSVTTPIRIEIDDSSGHLVRRFSSEADAAQDAQAEIYFSKAWLHPTPPLSREPGLHRIVWNLREQRPQSIQYEYSIAAVSGEDTPINPQGTLVLPGSYLVTLSVNGTRYSAPLIVRQDPRSTAPLPQLIASHALSQRIGASLARARRGYGETAAAHEQLRAALAKWPAKSSGSTDGAPLSALLEKTRKAKSAPSFDLSSGLLTAIATDLESSDQAPTEPQRRVAAAAISQIDALWDRWVKVRDQDLAIVNTALRSRDLPAVTIPRADQLVIKPPDGGEDLP